MKIIPFGCPQASGDDEAARARLELVMGNVPWAESQLPRFALDIMPPYGLQLE